jgi:hypothetical protein
MKGQASACGLLLAACGASITVDGEASTDLGSSEVGTTGVDEPDASEATTSEMTTGDDDPDDDASPEPSCGRGTAMGGDLLWSRRGFELGFDERSWSSQIAVTPGGGVVVSGGPSYYEPDTPQDVRTVMLSGDSTPQWADLYNGKADLADEVLGVAVDDQGFVHVLVAEQVSQVWGESSVTIVVQLVILRYGPDGTPQWRYVRPPPDLERNRDWVNAAIAIVDGDIVVVESAWSEPIWRFRLDRHGNVLDDTMLQIESTSRQQFAVTPSGDVYAVHDTYQQAKTIRVVLMGDDGAVRWVDEFGAIEDYVADIATDLEGGVTLLRVTRIGTSDREYSLARYDESGQQLFVTLLSAPNGFAASAVGVHCNDDILVGGTVASGPNDDPWVGRYTPDADPIWIGIVSPNPASPHTSTYHVVGSADGDVVALGRVDEDIWVARLGGS